MGAVRPNVDTGVAGKGEQMAESRDALAGVERFTASAGTASSAYKEDISKAMYINWPTGLPTAVPCASISTYFAFAYL